MNIIAKKYKFMWIHIPRTAGTSVTKAFNTLGLKGFAGRGGEFEIAELKEWREELFNEYFKFCFVRNSWDRFVSGYFNLSEEERWYDFNEFVIKFHNSYKLWNKILLDFPDAKRHAKNAFGAPQFIPQSKWFAIDGKIVVDYLARFENLQEEFKFICDKLKMPDLELPHWRKTEHKFYRKYYNKNTIKLIEEIYEEDIRLLGYNF